jgi:hypothetical protein
MGKNYRRNALAAVHGPALGLTEAGVMVQRTMKAFDGTNAGHGHGRSVPFACL